MKKRIALLVVLTMVFCLALTGCAPKKNGNDGTVTTDNSDFGGSAGTYDNSTSPTTSDGMFVYNVDGYTITCKTNVNNYISGDVFRFTDLAHDLGWHARKAEDDSNPNIMRFFWDSDNEYYAGFDQANRHDYLWVTCRDSQGRHVIFERNDLNTDSIMTYKVNSGGKYTVNYEQIVLLTYFMESMKGNPGFSPIKAIYSAGGVWTIYK